MRGGVKGNVNISNDDAHLHEGLILAKQAQLHEIVDTRLLEVGQVFCVVDMSLRIQISVTDFGWVEEFEISHAAIIVRVHAKVVRWQEVKESAWKPILASSH